MARTSVADFDEAGEPSLSEMTSAAIERLSRSPAGFFLMVEGEPDLKIDICIHDRPINVKQALSVSNFTNGHMINFCDMHGCSNMDAVKMHF